MTSRDSAHSSKHPLCVLLVWLGTLAFLCLVAGDARAEGLGETARGALLESGERLGLGLAGLGLWMIAGWIQAATERARARRVPAREPEADAELER